MKELYSINEILIAVNDLQNLKKDKKINKIETNKHVIKTKSDIPLNTLKLIEEAEKNNQIKEAI